MKIWPQNFDNWSTYLCCELHFFLFFFLIFFCVNRRKWKREVIFSPLVIFYSLVVWSCSIELNGYSYMLLNGNRISNDCLPPRITWSEWISSTSCGDVFHLLDVTLNIACGVEEKKEKEWENSSPLAPVGKQQSQTAGRWCKRGWPRDLVCSPRLCRRCGEV